MSTFLAKAKRAVLTETKNGREYVAIDFETVDEPKRTYPWAGYFGEDYGKDNLSTTQRTMKQLRDCGWKGDDVSSLSSVIGVNCDITIKTEEYNGQQQTKVSFVNLPGEGGFKAKPMESGKARSFARSLSAQAAQSANVRPISGNDHPNAPGNNSGPPPREPGSDDDAQF
jgi:hypothetical protein